MPKMSVAQCLVIAHWYAVVARTLSDASTLPGLSQSNVDELTRASSQLATESSNLATRAVQVEFADAGTAFQQVSDAASQASGAADQLATQAGKINNVLQIATKLLSLATAVLTGNYGNALNDLVALVGQPTPGQGAADPLGS